jgi:hypothetical protein
MAQSVLYKGKASLEVGEKNMGFGQIFVISVHYLSVLD